MNTGFNFVMTRMEHLDDIDNIEQIIAFRLLRISHTNILSIFHTVHSREIEPPRLWWRRTQKPCSWDKNYLGRYKLARIFGSTVHVHNLFSFVKGRVP